MANIHQTTAEIGKLDPALAKQVERYVKSHSYGLVYEQNLPDGVRLWTKSPQKGDRVHLLPQRGVFETAENVELWDVIERVGDTLKVAKGLEIREVQAEDCVTVADYRNSIYPGLKVIDKIERGEADDPYHMVINSENYHALEALSYAYAGKVDCIYIDPPYNTGAKDWKYNNDYVDGSDSYRHSKWLTFMERRLKLAKRLLNPEDSVLIVTIDEKEYLRLGMLLEQMFPEARTQMVSSVIKPSGNPRDGGFDRCDEYLFFVMIGNAVPCKTENNMLTTPTGAKSKDKEKQVNWRPLLRGSGNSYLRSERPNMFYPIFIKKNTSEIVSIGTPLSKSEDRTNITVGNEESVVFPINSKGEEARWAISKETCEKYLKKGYIRISDNGSIQYLNKGILDEIESGAIEISGIEKENNDALILTRASAKLMSARTVWNQTAHNASIYGTTLLKNMIGEERFTFPKSLYAVRDTIRFFVTNKPNALIVDFFAGSGTTLHATNLLNAEDGGHRRCICVTNNEVSADEQKKFTEAGLRHGDEEWEKYGIARYVTWPRTKCSIEGVNVNGEPLKGDYLGNGYTDGEPIHMADGFKANAVFCELTYESAWPIRLDQAFNAIAPILWMQSGCQGPIIEKRKKLFATTEYYGVLFDYSAAAKFVQQVKLHPSIRHVYVVTDDQKRYSNIVKRLPEIPPENVHRLYESYLKSFEIVGEGGLD